jgi:hypothetical protein
MAPHFTVENVGELIESATHRSKSEVEDLIARRFGPPGLPVSTRPMIRAVATLPPPPPVATNQLETVPVHHVPAGQSLDFDETRTSGNDTQKNYGQLAPGPVDSTQVQSLSQSSPVFLVRLVVPKSTRDKLSRAQALLSHSVPAGDLAQVFDRALDALISKLEVRKLGVSTRDFSRRGGSDSDTVTRYIPAAIRRSVWERDEGRCTFVSITGGRCRCRRYVQLDHVVPFARGGKATVENLRLRCSSHNQYEAERVFGVDFMRRKRQESREAAASEDRDHGNGDHGHGHDQ